MDIGRTLAVKSGVNRLTITAPIQAFAYYLFEDVSGCIDYFVRLNDPFVKRAVYALFAPARPNQKSISQHASSAQQQHNTGQ